MSSTCVDKIPCKDCGSSDSIQVYHNVDEVLGIEWFTSFCHSECWEPKGDPYANGDAPVIVPKTEAEIMEEIETVRSCAIFNKNFRQIPAKYFRSWGARLLLSEYDGRSPYAIGFPMSRHGKLIGWKCRPLRKKNFYGLGRTNDADPFGFERALKLGGDTLWITEGEFDAIALDYCMTLVGRKSAYPVISLTHGGGSIEKNLLQIMDRILERKYKRIVLVLDDDEVGHQAEVTAKGTWDKELIIVSKPKTCKDTNDAVLLGYEEEMGKLALNL